MVKRSRFNRNYAQEILDKLNCLDEKLDCLIDYVCRCLKPEAKASLGLHVSQIHGKGRPMATIPPIKMLDVEKVLLSVAPQKADGTPDDAVNVTWTSSDPAQVGIEPQDALGRSIYALTPLDTGVATVTATGAGYEPDTVEISYAPGQPRKLNLSAGTPVPE